MLLGHLVSFGKCICSSFYFHNALSQERNVDIRLRFCRSSRLSWDCIKVLQQLAPRMICAFARSGGE